MIISTATFLLGSPPTSIATLKSFSDIKLADTITKDLIVAEANEDIADVMWVMIEKNIRHIPVVEGGKIIGILSIRDLLKTQLSKLEAEIHYLKDYIAGASY
ncbi:MAG: CBS domain-containing protein [Thermodesulfovibrionales bacterium]